MKIETTLTAEGFLQPSLTFPAIFGLPILPPPWSRPPDAESSLWYVLGLGKSKPPSGSGFENLAAVCPLLRRDQLQQLKAKLAARGRELPPWIVPYVEDGDLTKTAKLFHKAFLEQVVCIADPANTWPFKAAALMNELLNGRMATPKRYGAPLAGYSCKRYRAEPPSPLTPAPAEEGPQEEKIESGESEEEST